MQHAIDEINDRIDALYGKYSGSPSFLEDLEQEHNEEVVNDRMQTPSFWMSLKRLR